jgi:hypothetical protein
MKIKCLLFFPFVLAALILQSCQPFPQEVTRGMYYWKSNESSLSLEERQLLSELSIKKLYVKFFEVEAHPAFVTQPISKTQLLAPDLSLEVVPTVFIHNEALQGLNEEDVDSLAANILFLCSRYYKKSFDQARSSFSEIQLDCDWTPSTRDTYFRLIRSLKQRSGKQISCTLRLYPYKYQDQMGVPPADRAMLMCYSLTNPLAEESVNSIQDNQRLEAYLHPAQTYPLPLDIALPLFSWALWYQNNQFSGILRVNPEGIQAVSALIRPMWYEVQQDTMIGESFLRRGDKIKLEEVSEKETLNTLELIKKYVHFSPVTTVSLFHLDTQSANAYESEMLDQYFTALQQ